MFKTIFKKHVLGDILSVATAALLCSALPAWAEPDFRNIAFHAVPLSGDALFNLSPTAVDTARDNNAGSEQTLLDSIAQYRSNIINIETSGGPFSPAVAQESEALGDLLARTGDYNAATEAYEKSLHILRVNDGLQSDGQAKIFRKIINTRLALDDIDRAHELHESLLYLQKHNHAEKDNGYVTAILEWADWNVDVLLLDNQPVSSRVQDNGFSTLNLNLVTAQKNYIEAIELIRQSPDISTAQQRKLVHAEKKLAAINYIANSKTVISANSNNWSLQDSNDPFSADQTRQSNAQMAFFFNGSSAFKRGIAYSLESSQPDYLSIAEQMMALGDWYLLFERRAAALSIYEDAFEVLDAIEASETDINRIMMPGLPVAVPAIASKSGKSTSGYQGYIDIEFRVSKFGIASRPEVIATSDQSDTPVTKALIRKIRGEKFRPAFIDGSATSSENVKLRYYYSYN